jgi:hypothetical protein
VVVEDGVGDGDHAAAGGEGAAEGEGVFLAEGGDVGGDEVRALGAVDLEAGVGEAVGEQVALGAEVVADAGVVRVGQREGLGDGVLEGARGDVGEELLGGADRGDQLRRRRDSGHSSFTHPSAGSPRKGTVRAASGLRAGGRRAGHGKPCGGPEGARRGSRGGRE